MTDDETMNRRQWLGAALGAVAGSMAIGVLGASSAGAAPPPKLTVYKDPSCGCCTKWVVHLKAAGLKPVARDRSDMEALKDSLGVPASLRSCHTAVVGRYVIEGHVPAADVKRLLKTAPKGVLGLAVPGMPAGSPGMETPGASDRYDVVAFSATGATHVFARH